MEISWDKEEHLVSLQKVFEQNLKFIRQSELAPDIIERQFVSSEGMDDYVKFIAKWHKEHPGSNHYDDYFVAILAESAERLPQFQRQGGDFVEWTIPETEHKLVMIASGFGDGFYQSFWGIDEAGDICELTVPLINPDLIEQANEEYLKIWDGPEYCIVSKHIVEGGEIGYMCREETSGQFPDSGWQFFGKNEDDAYWSDANNLTIKSIHSLAERFPNIVPLLKSPIGTAYFATDSGEFILDDFEE